MPTLIRIRAALAYGYTGDLTPDGKYMLVTEDKTRRSSPSKQHHPSQDWPLWAFLAAVVFGQPEDRGVGDTVARTLGGAGSEAFKRHHEAVFGLWAKPCGCAGQVALWNTLYPYPGSPQTPKTVSNPL